MSDTLDDLLDDLLDDMTVRLLGLIDAIEEAMEAHCCPLRVDEPLRRAQEAYDMSVEALALLRGQGVP